MIQVFITIRLITLQSQKLSNTYYSHEGELLTRYNFRSCFNFQLSRLPKHIGLIPDVFGLCRLLPNQGIMIMSLRCPNCHSKQIGFKNYGKKAGGAMGTAAGAFGGASGAMGGAKVGTTAGMIAGPVGAVLGGFAGALFGGLLGGAAGGATGSKCGEYVDDNILDNYQCLACGYSFSKRQRQ